MTTPKAIKYTLLFPATYFIISLSLYRETYIKGEGARYILYSILICLLLWGIGIFLGVIISAILKSPSKEPNFYFAGQILLIVLLLSFVIYYSYKEYQHEKEFGNVERNRSFLNLNREGENTRYSNPPYVKIAFNQLENEFKNKNDIRLTDFYATKRDSTNGTYTDTLHIIYFTYITKDKKEFFSKITVFENKAATEILYGNTLTSQEYISSKSKELKERKRQSKQINAVLKELNEALK